jgi:hypothetical protein
LSAFESLTPTLAVVAGRFAELRRTIPPIWRFTLYSTKTKIKIYKSWVQTVLLYGAETWKTDKRIESMFRGFERRPLRRMLGFTWNDTDSK